MTFDDITYNQLAIAEPQYVNAVKKGYVRNVPKLLTEQLVVIYEQATHKKLHKNYSCSQCVLNIYKTIGKLWLKDKEERQKNETIDTKPIT